MNKFKDQLGRWRTKSLFVEFCDHATLTPLFCLSDDKMDGDKYINLHKVYLEESDPTEYKVATKYFGGWDHWESLKKSFFVRPYLDKFKKELDIKLISEGVEKQRELAKKGNVNAAKWLAEKGFGKRKAGAPSKAEVEGERKIQAAVESDIEDDLQRILN